MALRRTAVEKHGAFDPSLGRTGKRLLGGEESDLFERLRKGGEQIWYVPDAVMWHIIGPEKLTEDYFDRLSFNVGRSQRARAEIPRAARYGSCWVKRSNGPPPSSWPPAVCSGCGRRKRDGSLGCGHASPGASCAPAPDPPPRNNPRTVSHKKPGVERAGPFTDRGVTAALLSK